MLRRYLSSRLVDQRGRSAHLSITLVVPFLFAFYEKTEGSNPIKRYTKLAGIPRSTENATAV